MPTTQPKFDDPDYKENAAEFLLTPRPAQRVLKARLALRWLPALRLQFIGGI